MVHRSCLAGLKTAQLRYGVSIANAAEHTCGLARVCLACSLNLGQKKHESSPGPDNYVLKNVGANS